jgi:hypothetical protein
MYSPINLFNFCIVILYCASYGLKFHTMFQVSCQFKTIERNEFWAKVNTLNSMDLEAQKTVYETLYWLNSGK